MVDYLILTEKASAANNFSTALGGMEGTINNRTYRIVHSQGHLLQLLDPHLQVEKSLIKKYSSWEPDNIPWNLEDFKWQKKLTNNSASKILANIRKNANEAKTIVIATDNDPSGEGELLAWEILEAINWQGQVLRAYFDDETPKSINKAMQNLIDVSNKSEDGAYLKGLTRQRWDYASVQFTRLATSYARSAGYSVKVANQGRLKSVIISLVAKRLNEIKNYVKKPYYEIKFKDDKGHIYSRKVKKDDEERIKQIRHVTKKDAQSEFSMYTKSHVGNIKRKLTTQVPPALLDLSGLDAILSKKGYSSKMIQDVYQQMYEKCFVSYPRTEDRFITKEQFNELLENADRIADVVGIDKRLLTHKEARKTHVKDSATHGANRPGNEIPTTLDYFSTIFSNQSQVNCAKDIYSLLAHNSLAILAEDYVYEEVRASLVEYPEFETRFTLPKKLNYRKIYNMSKTTNEKSTELGTEAVPSIFEGVNPKPKAPTKTWVYGRLNKAGKYGVGTGATRQKTMAEITNKKNNAYLLTDTKGKLDLTEQGQIAAIMCENTWIASPTISIRLFDSMDEVGKFKRKSQDIVNSIYTILDHDKPIIESNSAKLKDYLGKPSRITADFNGQTISFKRVWGNHEFTQDELDNLIAGKEIEFYLNGRKKRGKLAEQEYNGRKFWGFKPEQSSDGDLYVSANINGQNIKFKKVWGNHEFTQDELDDLIADKEIEFEYNGKIISGKLRENTFKGKKYWGFNKNK